MVKSKQRPSYATRVKQAKKIAGQARNLSNEYTAEFKQAKKIAGEALVLGSKLIRDAKAQYGKTNITREAKTLGKQVARKAKAQYGRTSRTTKNNLKKAAVIGALGLVGLAEAKRLMAKNKKKKR